MAIDVVQCSEQKQVMEQIAPEEQPRQSRRILWVLLLVGLAVTALAWFVLPTILLRMTRTDSSAPSPSAAPDGAALYTQHCANCHGERGDGVGPTAVGLFPKPRNFGEGKFRLKTTVSGTPCDDDLLETIRRGMPGTAMPSFKHLSDAELRALTAHIRVLTYGGLYTRFLRKAEEDDEVDHAEITKLANRFAAVGPAIEIPKQFAAATPDSIANGKKQFLAVCASCHGPEGKGDGPQLQKNDDGWPTRPRDLTSGIFKGSADHASLYARIVIGMPGSPMPASSQMKPEDVADLVNFIRDLSGINDGALNRNTSLGKPGA